ncbi:SPFH domain-containing protein, partial [Streptomyces sp. SID161]|nr:SPFH domain-containing protein [Streptomyces sp. SID161]
MSTTTSHTPPESEGQSDGAGAGAGTGTRQARLIQNEATTEIPVHLLFRDDPDPVQVPLRPAVVARRQGTGEQPRQRQPVAVRRRPLPEVDPELVERPARVLPGAAGLLAGACGLT